MAVIDPDANEPFGRYRFRGLDPKTVERWASDYENENAELRRQVAALEARAAQADAFAEEAFVEANALRETLTRIDAERESFAARQRMFRDEAAQIIHDAWAEANVVRAQAQQQADRTHAQLEAAKIEHAREIERMRAETAAEIENAVEGAHRALTAELEAHQSRIATLEGRHARLVSEIEAAATGALTSITALKASVPETGHGRIAAGDSLRAVHEAGEALSILASTMQRSLSAPPPGRQEMGRNGMYPSVEEFALTPGDRCD